MKSRLLFGALALMGAMTATACSDDDDPVIPGTLAVQVSNPNVSITQGASNDVLATVVRGGSFDGTVTLQATGAPAGMTITLSDGVLTSGEATSTVTIATEASLEAGTYPITITASGTGVETQTVTLNVTVMNPEGP